MREISGSRSCLEFAIFTIVWQSLQVVKWERKMTKLSRRDLALLGTAGVAVAAMASSGIAVASDLKGPGRTSLAPQQALARLREGNGRFVRDERPSSDISTKRRLALAQGQGPFAALVGCADSRVGPEHLFGAGLGELFIVRTAGNYVDHAGFGSLAYAVAELGVPLIVVMGHDRCGAVAAATAVVNDNLQLPAALSAMVEPILPAVLSARASLKEGENLLDASIRANVRRVVNKLRNHSDPIIGDPIKAGKVMVVGGIYDLDTGAVDFFDQ